MHCTSSEQGCCLILLSIINNQPESVRRSYCARHWACFVDVLEVLAAESALPHAVGSLVAEREKTLIDSLNVSLKDTVFDLMDHRQHWPGEH